MLFEIRILVTLWGAGLEAGREHGSIGGNCEYSVSDLNISHRRVFSL